MGAGFQESSVSQSDFSVAVPKMAPNPTSKIDFSEKIELKMKISKFRYSIIILEDPKALLHVKN